MAVFSVPVSKESANRVQDAFSNTYQSKQVIYNLVIRFEAKGTVHNLNRGKSGHHKHMIKEDVLKPPSMLSLVSEKQLQKQTKSQSGISHLRQIETVVVPAGWSYIPYST